MDNGRQEELLSLSHKRLKLPYLAQGKTTYFYAVEPNCNLDNFVLWRGAVIQGVSGGFAI
jgi:hypothetical protein